MVEKWLVCLWSRFQMRTEIRETDHLKLGQIAAIKKTVELQIWKGLVLEWLGL